MAIDSPNLSESQLTVNNQVDSLGFIPRRARIPNSVRIIHKNVLKALSLDLLELLSHRLRRAEMMR
jgi:hypothetical protein